MALGARGIVERRETSLRSRHRMIKPSTTEGQIEALATIVSDETVADHVANADPHTQYQKETEKGVAGGYASLDGGGTVPDAQIPAAISRDAEVTAAIAAAVAAHEAAGNPHPTYATDADLATHAAAADPHAGYQKESEKDVAGGYPGLASGAWVPADGSGAGLALTVSNATYIQIGKMVFAVFRIVFPGTANGLAATISGLPFNSRNTANAVHPVVLSVVSAGIAFTGVVNNNAATFQFVTLAGALVTNAQMSGSTLHGMAIYEAA